MQLIIDLEQDTFVEIEDNLEDIGNIINEVAILVSRGYTSGIEPSWYIEDETNPDTMYWLKFMKTQMQSGCHLSETDVQRCIEAVNEIEAVRDKMLKQFKKVEE